jgi:hypothetical protein
VTIEANNAGETTIRIDKLTGSRINTDTNPNSVSFDVDVKMDEVDRSNNELEISFLLTISTKPALVQFEAGGTAMITGGRKAFEAALEADKSSNVPRLLHTIYQKVFTSIFLVSSLIDAPFPPPDLLHAPSETRDLEAGMGAEGVEVTAQM